MEILRLLRNIAVLFILLMALLASRSGVSTPKPAEACVGAVKSGYSCSVVFLNGRWKCTEIKCPSTESCADNRCAKFY